MGLVELLIESEILPASAVGESEETKTSDLLVSLDVLDPSMASVKQHPHRALIFC